MIAKQKAILFHRHLVHGGNLNAGHHLIRVLVGRSVRISDSDNEAWKSNLGYFFLENPKDFHILHFKTGMAVRLSRGARL